MKRCLLVAVVLAALLFGLRTTPVLHASLDASISRPVVVESSSLTNQDTWAVFNHSFLGYSFQYPKSLHLSSGLGEVEGIPDIISLSTDVPGTSSACTELSVPYDRIRLDIGVFEKKKPSGTDLSTWYADYLKELADVTGMKVDEPTMEQPIQIAAASALRILTESGPNNHELILVPRGERVYFVQKWPMVSLYDDVFARILDSLRFRAPSSASLSTPASTNQPPSQVREINAPAGYRLPFQGTYSITSGPRCHCQHYSDPVNCSIYAASAEAIDFGLPMNTSVYAAQAGTVAYRDYNTQGFGYLVIIQDAAGQKAYDAHLSSFSRSLPPLGQSLAKSIIVGYSGNSGGVPAHLHFEVRTANNSPVVISDMSGLSWNADRCTGSATY